jgi:hypothetical protein
MAHTWDQEMMRLHNRIEVLEKENRMLRSMLLDAIGITDAALADCGERKEKAEPELPQFRPLQERGV